MTATLEIGALRSLVAIADTGGFHHASRALRISQSAISQHVRKLEVVLGRPVVERHGRGTRFTVLGEALLAEARLILAAHDTAIDRLAAGEIVPATITVGSTEHAADHLLPYLRQALAEHRPDAHVRFRIDRGARLNEALDQAAIDVAVFVGDADTPASEPAGELPLSWYAAPDYAMPQPPEPIPLVVIDEPCIIRRKALRTLAGAERTAVIVGESGYLAGVLNAARAGLGVALLANVGSAPEGLEHRPDLPHVRPEPLHIRRRLGADPGLGQAVRAAVHTALSRGQGRDSGVLMTG
jgi:molybdate transport repressor ModE-like protein